MPPTETPKKCRAVKRKQPNDPLPSPPSCDENTEPHKEPPQKRRKGKQSEKARPAIGKRKRTKKTNPEEPTGTILRVTKIAVSPHLSSPGTHPSLQSSAIHFSLQNFHQPILQYYLLATHFCRQKFNHLLTTLMSPEFPSANTSKASRTPSTPSRPHAQRCLASSNTVGNSTCINVISIESSPVSAMLSSISISPFSVRSPPSPANGPPDNSGSLSDSTEGLSDSAEKCIETLEGQVQYLMQSHQQQFRPPNSKQY